MKEKAVRDENEETSKALPNHIQRSIALGALCLSLFALAYFFYLAGMMFGWPLKIAFVLQVGMIVLLGTASVFGLRIIIFLIIKR